MMKEIGQQIFGGTNQQDHVDYEWKDSVWINEHGEEEINPIWWTQYIVL